jgi:eukaryotic-like serine/threonine-protein kinase
LFYQSPDNQLMAASISVGGDRIEVEAQQPLFEMRAPDGFIRDFYDVASNGQRFMLIVPDETTSNPLTLVSSWPTLLGQGGMGQVYRATDTRLKRQVAIKILPSSLAADADRLSRFQREAEVLAALNHPNIAAIYGFEESDGVSALVMEMVEGEDLSHRIARGALPVDDALPIAKQIADALEAAHQQGIIHRDLKPANIKVRPDGAVKVLDFGLAKALAPEQDPARASPRSQAPTITSPALLTGAGVVLGTAAYMAPEQAKGLEADKRSDLWAFGCVLYEMLTGRRPFDGEDIAEVLGAVVRLEPTWDALPSDVPAPVRALLRQCLVKDRRRRVGDIAAVLFVLDHQASLAPAVPVTSRSTRVAWLVAALAAIASLAAALVAVRVFSTGTTAPDLVQFTIAPPENLSFRAPITGGTGNNPQLAISPDGRNIVFVAGAQSTFHLWLRPVNSAEARQIQGTADARFPFWSPDSQAIAFFAGGKLKKVAIAGGPVVEVTDAPAGRGGSWSRDNVIVFDRGLRAGLFRVPSAGGVPTAVTTLADGEDAHRWPHFLPDGHHFLYNAVFGACCPPATPGALRVGSLDPSEPTVTLFEADSSAAYVSGHLLFARDQTLMAQPFDPDARQLAGEAVPVVDRISREGSRYVSASRLGERDARVRHRRFADSPAVDMVRSDRRHSRYPWRSGRGREPRALTRQSRGRTRASFRESGEPRHLDGRPHPKPAESRDLRCTTRGMARLVARRRAHRSRHRLARLGRTRGRGESRSDAGQRNRGA